MADNPDKPIDSKFSLVPRQRQNSHAPVEYVDVPSSDLEEGEGASFSEYLDMVKRHRPDPASSHVQVIGGNLATREGAQAFVDAGSDAV